MKKTLKSLTVRALATACLLALPALAQAAEQKFKTDPAKTLGAENCKECHAPIYTAWEQTHHFRSFSAGFGEKPAMHRSDEAKAILKKMGMRSAKRDLCVECHYTGQASDSGRIRTISGTSCESCHSGGKDWNKIHSDKENPNALKDAEKLGMIRPHHTYAVAANCFTCHTVPQEKLVNVGGHTAGSDFELVAWSQGEIRHNLQKTEGKSNPEASPERKRKLYVVGRLLDLEYGLRGLAKATEDGIYSQAMIKRVNNALAKLKEAQSGAAAVGGIISDVDPGQLKHGNAAALNAIADSVSKKSMAFAEAEDGSGIAGVDSLLPAASAYKGKVHQP